MGKRLKLTALIEVEAMGKAVHDDEDVRMAVDDAINNTTEIYVTDTDTDDEDNERQYAFECVSVDWLEAPDVV
jgi:hypothetical protein